MLIGNPMGPTGQKFRFLPATCNWMLVAAMSFFACESKLDVGTNGSAKISQQPVANVNPNSGGEEDPYVEPKPLVGFSADTGNEKEGDVILAWELPDSTEGYQAIVIARIPGGPIDASACLDPKLVIQSFESPFEVQSFTDPSGGTDGAPFSYVACVLDTKGEVIESKTVNGVESFDGTAPSPFNLVDISSGPGEGQVTVDIDFKEIPEDLANVWLVMAQGNTPPDDCSNGAKVSELSPPFEDTSVVVDTGNVNGEPVSFRICAADEVGNTDSSGTFVNKTPQDTVAPPDVAASTVVNAASAAYVDYNVTMPALTDDVARIDIRYGNGGATPAATCDDGNLLISLTENLTGVLTGSSFSVGESNQGFRVCVYDSSDNLTSGQTVAPFYVPGCDGGYYSDTNDCVSVGAQYYSPADDSDRLQCDAGRYCATVNNTSGAGDGPCTAGYYCPVGSNSPTQENAGIGKYTTTGSVSRLDCAAGRFCSTVNNVDDQGDGPCTAGYYCPAGSTNSMAEDAGIGKYTPTGAPARLDCAAGRYCSTVNNTTDQGNGPCQAGYYCPVGSSSPTAVASGLGSYTLVGATPADVLDCGAGKYCPNAANTSADRADCAGGRYCSTLNNSNDQGDGACTAGYFCPAGSSSATQNNCPIGSYCTAGVAAATACSNAPNYSTYTTLNHTNATCPFSCNAGHTLDSGLCKPDCSITGGPATWVNVATANFTISCTNIGTVECSFDGGAYGACDSPTAHALSGLTEGSYTLDVRSTDGSVIGLPDTHSWSVDTTDPTVTITVANEGDDPSFTYTNADPGGSGAVSAECKLDGGAWAACGLTSTSYSNVGFGNHTFRVRVTDAAGNVSAEDSHAWDVGNWYQSNSQNCPSRCSGLGKVNTQAPDGARCTAGEWRSPSANGQVSFTYGTWGGFCTAGSNACNKSSFGNYCYGIGQTQDGDGTDLTVGCFCK
jgi:hypothetical protein